MVTIPEEELDLLCNTVARAVDLAREGLLADGHGELVYGLRRAEAIRNEALEAGTHAPWMGELLTRWRFAVDKYCESYGAHPPTAAGAARRSCGSGVAAHAAVSCDRRLTLPAPGGHPA